MMEQPVSSDFLVVGSGIAGLCFAIHASSYGSVVIVTKKSDSDSNTNHAQGGIACVVDPHDSFESHRRDTLEAGKGLCREEAVQVLVEEGPQRLSELIDWGVRFSTSSSSEALHRLDLGKEGGHSVNRIVHARDLTGKEVERALLARIRSLESITLYENHSIVELITNHHLRRPRRHDACYGAFVLDRKKNTIRPFRARMTCLASGGSGRVYRHTTNPAIATGDGVACAYRAGVTVANMEFFQFHPTALYHKDGESFLISEALRGYGAVLKTAAGVEFMKQYHRLGSLAPRDVVARAIDFELKRSGESCVYLDVRHMPGTTTRKKFPTIYRRCRELGIDITREQIPVVPAAHYGCGGIAVDIEGNSSMKNLYACGETACTGVHGANRLASNSLLEALVFSRRAVVDAASRLSGIRLVGENMLKPWDDSGVIHTEEWILLNHDFDEIQSVMWDYVGIVRSNLRLDRALRRIRLLENEIEDFYRRTAITNKLLELRNLATIAHCIITSARRRHESRGLHYTTDYPHHDDRYWKRDTCLVKTIS